ncbi:hypothetical protein WJX84_009445, partial [Apatococcus fuscideae]
MQVALQRRANRPSWLPSHMLQLDSSLPRRMEPLRPICRGDTDLASALPSVTSRRISASDTGIFANIAKEIDQPSEPAAAASGQQPLPRLLACALMKNEVPYVVEWVEFHRVMGFDHIVVYDDFSADNATLLNELYIQHDRHYLTVEQGIWDEDPRIRRIKSAWDCYAKYKDQSDWLIHLDIDEFIWSPIYPDLPAYFLHEISTETHIVYAGATRFGFNGQKSRHSYALHRAQYGEEQVQLTNLAGVQLLTDTHIMRAPDSRWAEPEEIIHASLAVCQGPPKSKCTNDNNGLHGKTFVRSSLAHGLWTHGGSVKGDFGPHRADEWGFRVVSLGNGGAMHTDDCPAPICQPSGIAKLHIYHMRSPSIEDAAKKNADWQWT